MTRTIALKRLVDPSRPITYGIVQAGEDVAAGVPYIRPVDMDGHRGVDTATLRTTSHEIARAYSRSSLLPGDVVVSIGPSYGKTMIVPVALKGANLTQGTARIAPSSGVDARYLVWALQSTTAVSFWDSAVGGATFRALNLGPLAETPVPVWGLREQRRIADFLDTETAQIDTLIAEQDRFITLVRERRAAEITRAVLGEGGYPEVELRYLSGIPIEAGANEQGNHLNPGEWPRFIRTTDIASMDSLDPLRRVTVSPDAARPFLVARDDILMTRAGTVGKAYIHESDEVACYAGYLVRWRVDRRRVVPRYMAYWTQTRHFADQVATGMVKSTIENYSASKYRATRAPVPPRDVQAGIVAQLDASTAQVDELVAEAKRNITLLKERRAALITAAVIGQVDVWTGKAA